MMREGFLAVRGDTFDVKALKPEIEAIAECFGEYLAGTGKGGRSKHRALGAVGKALQHARTVRGAALLGYARRVHEQTTENAFPGGAVLKLDDGLRRLDALLGRDGIPARAAAEILERVDYATYYDVRRRQVELLAAWSSFVRENATRLGLAAVPERLPLAKAKVEVLGEMWVKAREEFLTGYREAQALADDDQEDAQ